MAMSQTTTLTQAEIEKMLNQEIADEAKKALKTESTGVWRAIEKFIEWMRGLVKNFLASQLAKLPVVGKWASRIGVSISEFLFSVVGTALHFLRIVFTSPKVWGKAHDAALKAWSNNENNGLLAQIYAYSKRMSGFFLEIVIQCLERAIIAHNLQVTPEEKQEITNLLDDLLP